MPRERRQRRDPLAVAFGLAARWYREDRGWSQETAAYRSDLHPKHLGTIERGDRSPTLHTIFKLSAGLEVAPGELLDATEGLLHGTTGR